MSASRSTRREGSGRSDAGAGSIEPRPRRPGGSALRPTRDQLTGLVMTDPPGAVFADEQIAGHQGAAAEFLFADDEGGLAVQQHLLVITDDPWRIGVRQDAAPALDDRLPIGERGPARMDAGDRRGLGP